MPCFVLLFGAGILNGISSLRGNSNLRDLVPSRAHDWFFATAGVFFALTALAVVLWPMPPEVTLYFPVDEGTWFVAQGGSTAIGNHHHRVQEQRYALDLVRIGPDGRSFKGSASSLISYHAWGSSVVAPCEGIVTAAVDGFPDMEVGTSDRDNPAGNYVELETVGGIRIVLAHLQKGSVVVREGQKVAPGDLLGKVGNSGNTSEPHLHIHAMSKNESGDWVGVPMRVGGRSLRRGQTVRIPER